MSRSKSSNSLVIGLAHSIVVVRRQRVMLDSDLATLYGVTTKRLNEQVKRNAQRFPGDFLFQLTPREVEALNRSQIATGSRKHRDPRYRPYAFTEHGAIMAAVETSVYVVRAFVHLREALTTNSAIARKLGELERKFRDHDQAIATILSALRELTTPSVPKRRGIGFTADLGKT